MRLSDAVLADLKARHPCDDVAARYVRLRRAGKKKIGPCPVCSPDRASRSATRFECDAASWVCAVCADGGDVIRLIERVERVDFRRAVDILGGVRAIDAAAEARAAKEREQIKLKREQEAARYRERERRRLYAMWLRAAPIFGTPVEDYLRLRGLIAPPHAHLRYLADACLFAHGGERAEVVHRGPAMLAAIIGVDGRFAGLHLTYIDLAQPKGKAVIHDPVTGEVMPAKKARGHKQGGHIVLAPSTASSASAVRDDAAKDGPRRLVLGEGIEKTLAVWQALAASRHDISTTAFWSAIDLGNLGGKALQTEAHPRLKTAQGRPLRVPGREPDMAAAAIPIPDSVEDVILLGDSTSDRFTTECALIRAARRWTTPQRRVRIAWAPEGRDFDEVYLAASSGLKLDDEAANSLEAA